MSLEACAEEVSNCLTGSSVQHQVEVSELGELDELGAVKVGHRAAALVGKVCAGDHE